MSTAQKDEWVEAHRGNLHALGRTKEGAEAMLDRMERERWRGISRCWQNLGFHVYSAGPCFDTHEQAIRYRNSLDREGVTWRRQP